MKQFGKVAYEAGRCGRNRKLFGEWSYPRAFHGRLHNESKANLPDSLSLRSAGKMAATSPNDAWWSNLLPPFGNIAPHPWRCLELDQRWSEDQRHHYFVEPLGNKL
jgi:hypothetical protein